MDFSYNPFHDSGITNYEQFKIYPFLVFGALENITTRISQQIKQIQNNHFFPERMILLGERGIGKTSTLFFIKDMLDDKGIKTILFSRLFEDEKQILDTFNNSLSEKYRSRRDQTSFFTLTSEPIYLLIDFPDAVDNKIFKKFLEYLWVLMTHKNYNKINLIFSMNKSHYERAFSYSETLGKFLTLRLERLNMDECEQLISSRLKKIDKKVREIFDVNVQEVIYNYSKGIPRNIISASSLLVDNLNGKDKMTTEIAQKILNEKYFDQVINDRVTDLDLKRIYQQMVAVLESDFKGTATSQEDYVKRVMEIANIGRNSILARIGDLSRFGILKVYRGGYNRINKIISFS